ncbi:hypothetical protein F4678DRAFT_449047 [Xylaria arbuscula]|nr:hypothetical protein F4678DRAFT_449047 [Xylaria arbuscula]
MSELREFGRVISGNRQPKQKFKLEVRGFIIGAAAAGASQTAIAKAIGTRCQRVNEQLQRFKQQHIVHSKLRCGRPRLFKPCEKR